MVPTLKRPKNIIALSKSIASTAEEKNAVEVIFGIHGDDLPSFDAVKEVSDCGIPVRSEVIDRYSDGKAHLSFFWNQLYKKTIFPIIGFFGDDVEFRTPGWDREVRKEFEKDQSVMVACNDWYIQRGFIITLFFTHRSIHDKVGYYMFDGFRRWFLDSFWGESFKQAGKLRYREDIVTAHYSPDAFHDRKDETYMDMECFKGQDTHVRGLESTHQEVARVAAIIRGIS